VIARRPLAEADLPAVSMISGRPALAWLVSTFALADQAFR